MFRTSTYCTSSGCVEVDIAEQVTMRDTTGNTVQYSPDEWRVFLLGCTNHEFDVETPCAPST